MQTPCHEASSASYSFCVRLSLAIFLLILLFSLPFIFLGGMIEGSLSGEGALEWMRDLGAWGAAAGVTLLLLDLFLPVPATAVLFGMGALYGPYWGALLGFIGSFGAGVLGYGLARRFGRRAALRVLGRSEYRRAEALTENYGGAMVACSRWIPILPEVVSVGVGLSNMPLKRFLLASTVGSAPMAIVFASLGSWSTEEPGKAIGVVTLLSVVTWWAAVVILRKPKVQA
ncbi:MAG: putative membrane protein YdjX (TVP38/TMEM64 family) [Planctomycetota bacterium]|jgi:uncharacterized membrane protein YdjX (TVP38/TMEM64 family)